MDNKRAIEILETFRYLMDIPEIKSDEVLQVLDKAIEALQAQADGEYITQSAGDEIRQKNYDLISRQAVLASIKNLYPDMPIVDIFGARRKWLEKYAPYFECENAVEQLLSVNPQEPSITWVTGADGAKIAFWDVPVWKVTKICEILGEPQEGANE